MERPEEGAEIINLLTLVARRLRLVAALAIAGGLIFLLLNILEGPRYRASSSFLPHVPGDGLGRYAGLASQLGITTPSAGPGESVWFYARLVKSTAILKDLASRPAFPENTRSAGERSIGEAVVGGTVRDGSTSEAVEALRKRIDTQMDLEAGIVAVHTVAPTPELAVTFNQGLLDLLNEFNMNRRTSQAAAERQFIEERLREARAELVQSERDLQRFLERNRSYDSSPELTLEYQRLQRHIALNQQVFASLAEAFEQARIEEVRNTPVLNIIDRPEDGVEREDNYIIDFLIGFSVGGFLGLLWLVVGEHASREKKRNPEQVKELAVTLKSVVPGWWWQHGRKRDKEADPEQ